MRETRVWSLSQEDPWRRKWQPTPRVSPRKFRGQRCLLGYSPWGGKESEMTEQMSMQTHMPGDVNFTWGSQRNVWNCVLKDDWSASGRLDLGRAFHAKVNRQEAWRGNHCRLWARIIESSNVFVFFLATPCGLQDLSFLTRDQTWVQAVKAPSPNHWTTK